MAVVAEPLTSTRDRARRLGTAISAVKRLG